MTQILEALERVRQGADVMPKRQLMKVIEAELGSNWRHRLQSFEDEPIASASIGQVSCSQIWTKKFSSTHIL